MRIAMHLATWMKQFWSNRRGVSAVEFALIAPIFVLLLGSTADIGLALMKRFDINSAISAGANFTLLRADDITPANAATLAGQIASVVEGNLSGSDVTVRVNVNNSTSLTLVSGEPTPGTETGSADACYCPTRNAAGIHWGSSTTCGSACQGGGLAGKFVEIDVSQPHDPLVGALSGNISGVRVSTFLQAK
jgi:Flp pilus assembly protein TadG